MIIGLGRVVVLEFDLHLLNGIDRKSGGGPPIEFLREQRKRERGERQLTSDASDSFPSSLPACDESDVSGTAGGAACSAHSGSANFGQLGSGEALRLCNINCPRVSSTSLSGDVECYTTVCRTRTGELLALGLVLLDCRRGRRRVLRAQSLKLVRPAQKRSQTFFRLTLSAIECLGCSKGLPCSLFL